MATFGSFINLREKLFVKPATGLSTASAALPWWAARTGTVCTGESTSAGCRGSRDRTSPRSNYFARSVSGHASPHSSRVACCLHRYEPNRYRLMDDWSNSSVVFRHRRVEKRLNPWSERPPMPEVM